MFHLKKRRLRRDFVFHNYLKGVCGKVRVGLFQAASDRKRGTGLRLYWGGSSWILGKIFFTESLVKRWNRLPRELVELAFLEVFVKQVDMALHNVL